MFVHKSSFFLVFEVCFNITLIPLHIFINLNQWVFIQNKYRLVNVFRITDLKHSEVLRKVNNNLLNLLQWCNKSLV